MRCGCVIVCRGSECLGHRQYNFVVLRAIKRLVSVMLNSCASISDEHFGQLIRGKGGRRYIADKNFTRQVFNLRDIEQVKCLCHWEIFVFSFLRVFLFNHVEENASNGFFTLAHVRADSLRLLKCHPLICRVSGFNSSHPKQQNINTAIRFASCRINRHPAICCGCPSLFPCARPGFHQLNDFICNVLF